MVTLLEAIAYAKKAVKNGEIIGFSVDEGTITAESDQGLFIWYSDRFEDEYY